jgi:hypothetical protein
MPVPIALLLTLALAQPAATPPPILYIAREPILAGHEAEYRAIEEDTARLSATLGCPHPYLAMETLTGPKEIWWFNGFQSSEELTRVGEAYRSNAPFAAAQNRNRERKAAAIGKVVEVAAKYRPDLTHGAPWIVGHGRLAVIAISRDPPAGRGTVFEGADGAFYAISPARSRKQADRLAASTPGATVVEARPLFSFPAKDWVDADPGFWRADGRP